MNPKVTPKLISTNIVEYQSKAHMELANYRVENALKAIISDMKKNGLVRLMVSQIWNKTSSFKLSFNWKHLDDKAFTKCQKILKKNG